MSESVRHRNKSLGHVTNREINLRRNKADGRWYDTVWNIFTEFSKKSSIHGIRYLGDRTLHWTERFVWLVSLLMSVFVCIYFIHQVWLKLTPVVITFNDQATPISEIPFPTITLCSDSIILASTLNYSLCLEAMDNDFNISDYDVQCMYAVSALCKDEDSIVEDYIYRRNVQVDRNILPYLKNVSPEWMQYCFYVVGDFGFYDPCYNGFSEVLTESGLCYTFNHLSSAEIYKTEFLADDFPKVQPFQASFQDYRDKKATVNITYPYRMQHSGGGIHLSISLPKYGRLFDELCSFVEIRNSVNLFIHSAEDVREMDKLHYVIPLEERAHLTVRPNIILTDDSLYKNYDKYDRKCIAENENELKFFQKYTQSNCHLESVINETLKQCNCSHFWMPRENDTKICIGRQLKCTVNVEYEIFKNSSLTDKCLPACNSISYDGDIKLTKLPENYGDGWYSRVNGDRNQAFGYISIYFKNEQYIGLRRSESYGKIDFIAGCGGILTLFMGFSFVSIIELVYFTTLRVFCTLRYKRRAKTKLNTLNDGTVSLETQTNPMASEIEIEASEN